MTEKNLKLIKKQNANNEEFLESTPKRHNIMITFYF